jgi:hypothetical protein
MICRTGFEPAIEALLKRDNNSHPSLPKSNGIGEDGEKYYSQAIFYPFSCPFSRK